MSKYYLLKFSDNWADEMDIDGHIILTEKQGEVFKKAVATKPTFTMYIGTNEDIEYDNKWSKVEDAYNLQEITQEQVSVLRELGLEDRGFAERFFENVVEAYAEANEVDWDELYGEGEEDGDDEDA